MLQRFANDKAVDRLIIVENDGDNTSGRITYNGPPSELPQSVQSRLGDGYSIQVAESDSTQNVTASESSPDEP